MKYQPGSTMNGKIHLPDITGLTSAVESPAKTGLQHYPYSTGDRPRDSEGKFSFFLHDNCVASIVDV